MNQCFIFFCFVLIRGTYLERQTNKIGHAATGSVALPAVMRAGGPGMVCITLSHRLLKKLDACLLAYSGP